MSVVCGDARVRCDVPDEELLAQARQGVQAALEELLDRYRRLTRQRARAFYLVGGEPEDLIQEAMIGLYKAVRDFSAESGSSFRAFAELCVTRQIVSAIKAASRIKHRPLNGYVSFYRPVPGDEGEDRLLVDVIPAPAAQDPAEVVISRERVHALRRHLAVVLSDLERDVLRLYVDGKSYTEIAELLRRQVKAVDNALQRIKRKLELHLAARELAEAG